MILRSRPKTAGYWCTPLNSLKFAGTGGDGVHFSFVVKDGKVTESSPIVVTVPESYDCPNFIGGESLFDFLCLGFHRGYFALGMLSTEKCLAAYSSADWQLKTDSDHAVGYGVDEHQQNLLNFLIEKLGLSPWKNLKRRFQRLQKLYLPRLEIPAHGLAKAFREL